MHQRAPAVFLWNDIVGGSSPDTTTRRFIFMKRGKKYQDAVKSLTRRISNDVAGGNQLSKKNATAKFDETIELISRPVVMDVMQSSRSVAQLYCRTEQVRL